MANAAWRPRPLLFALLASLCLAGPSRFCTASAEDPQADSDPPASQSADSEAGPVVAIVGASVVTEPGSEPVDGATLLIRGSKVEAVGKDIAVPDDARVIAAEGLTVTPGLIDLRSTLWMTFQAISDRGNTAAIDAIDGVDIFSGDWREVAKQGVTSVYIQPAPEGYLGGHGVLLRVADVSGDMESLTLEEQAGFQSSLGVATASSSSRARLGEFNNLKKRLSDAKKYKEELDKYNEYVAKKKAEDKKKSEAEKPEEKEAKPNASAESGGSRRPTGRPGAGRRGPPGQGGPEVRRPDGGAGDGDAQKTKEEKPAAAKDDSKSDEKKEEAPKKPKFDALKERLIPVLNGDIPLRFEVHRADDAKRALEIAKEFKVSLVLEGLSDLGSAADQVLEAGLPVVLGPWLDDAKQGYQSTDRVDNWGDQFSNYKGRIAIATFARTGRASKTLREAAARAVAAGMNKHVAMRAITTVPAEIASAGDRLGRIAPGYQADLAVFSGDPLDPSTPVVMTFSAGELTYESSTDAAAASGSNKIAAEPSDSETLPSRLPNVFAVRSQRVLNGKGQFEPALLIIRNGKIAKRMAADAKVDVARIIDVGALCVTPGLVTAHATLTPGAFSADQGVVDAGSLRAADVFDPDAPLIKELVAGGFLRAGHAPGDARVIAGPLAEVRLGATEPIVTPVIAEKVVFSGDARSRERFPASLAGQQQLLRESLESKAAPMRLFLPEAALEILDQDRAARQQALSSAERMTLIRAETETEIVAVIKLAGELGLKATLLGPDDLQATSNYLAKAKIGVVTRPKRSVDFDWFVSDLAEAVNGGVALGFSGTNPLDIRSTAAALVQAGVAPEKVMVALTHGGASLVGMSNTAGKLRPGAPADMVVWSDSPLQMSATPLAVIVDGKLASTED